MNAAQLTAAAFVIGISLLTVLVGGELVGGSRLGRPLATLAFVLAGAGFGAYCFDGRAKGVPVSQALGGAALAGGLMVALPAAAYLQLGYYLRPRRIAFFVWGCSLILLLIYLFVVGIHVWGDLSCPPGEDCSLFG